MLPAHPICIKYQDENNNILSVDTSELRFGGVRNSSSSWKLVLELSSLNHTYSLSSIKVPLNLWKVLMYSFDRKVLATNPSHGYEYAVYHKGKKVVDLYGGQYQFTF